MTEVESEKEQTETPLLLSEMEETSLPKNPLKVGEKYIPPFKMNKIIAEIRDKNDTKSEEYQKIMWDLLSKSINGIINKVNISNIQNIIYELFNENLLRGQGLLIKCIIRGQLTSSNYTPIYAALICVLNSKLPFIGNLYIRRYIALFKKAYKESNKIQCISTTKMIAHLINYRIVDPLLAFEILMLCLENQTDDSLELSCNFLIECGEFLSDEDANMTNDIFEKLRSILEEGNVDKRIQYLIENLFKIRKNNFKGHESIKEELDLVEDKDIITHRIFLDDDIKTEDELNEFHYDDKYDENEKIWKQFRECILGPEEENDEEEEKMSSHFESTERALSEFPDVKQIKDKSRIYDLSEQDLVKYRKSIYLIVVSSIDFEECCHKLLKQNVQEGLEGEMVNMIIECCVQERTYLKFYGLLSERLCLIKDVYKHNYEKQFDLQYIKLHRLETNKLRNLANLYAHLLYTEAIDWMVLSVIKLTEDDTTASSRIFLKIMFQELNNLLGEEKLKEKMMNGAKDEYVGMFCRENPTNTRFCINFFTAIGLGYLTDDLRAFLDNVKNIYSNDIQANNFSSLLDEEKKENEENEKKDEKKDEKNEKNEKKIDEDLEKLKEKIREKEKMRQKLLESETEKERNTNTEMNNSDDNKSIRSSSISQTESSIISVESKGRRKGRSRKKKSEKGSISRSRRRMKSRSRSRSPTHKTTKTNKTKRSKKSRINSSVSRVEE
jgi:pre-mRNA-splicing factor CWC22